MGAFKGPSVCRLAAVGWCAHGRPSSGGSPTRSRRPPLRGACNLPVLATRGSRGRGSCAWDAPAGWEVRWSEPLPAHAAARAAPVDRSPAGPAGRSGARPQAQPRAWVPVSVASARPRLPRAGAAGRRSAGQGRRGRGPGAAAPAEDRPEHPAPRCMLGRQPPPGQFSSDLSLDPGNSGSWCCSVLGACPAFAPHGV